MQITETHLTKKIRLRVGAKPALTATAAVQTAPSLVHSANLRTWQVR